MGDKVTIGTDKNIIVKIEVEITEKLWKNKYLYSMLNGSNSLFNLTSTKGSLILCIGVK